MVSLRGGKRERVLVDNDPTDRRGEGDPRRLIFLFFAGNT